MKIIDWLKATHAKWPHQKFSVNPISHWDDLEENGSHDFVVTMVVGNKTVAYRVNLETALAIDGWVNRALQEAVSKGKPVNIHTAKPEDENEIDVNR